MSRTCGASGDGDCFLSLREGPSPDTEESGRLDEGTTVLIRCEVVGELVWSSVLDAESNVWAVTSTDEFVAGIFLDAAELDLFEVTLPC